MGLVDLMLLLLRGTGVGMWASVAVAAAGCGFLRWHGARRVHGVADGVVLAVEDYASSSCAS